MNPWAAIDELKRKHEREMRDTTESIKQMGGAYIRVDELGRWRCSLNLGDGMKKPFEARSGEALVKAVADYLKPATGKKP